MTWTVDYVSESGIVLSRLCRANDVNWIEIYDWCNEEFNANNWHFWYQATPADDAALIINFEFMQEQDAVQFQLRWG